MRRKYREIEKWTKDHTAKGDTLQCTECLKPIISGSFYKRKVCAETSDSQSRSCLVVMREHLSPGCNQYER